MYQIEGKLEATLLAHLQHAIPLEAGGVIIDGEEVILLDNQATEVGAFAFNLRDLRAAIEHIPVSEIANRVALWHTHPNGGVGPSREDMQNRTPLKHHLVLTYFNGGLVPTWY